MEIVLNQKKSDFLLAITVCLFFLTSYRAVYDNVPCYFMRMRCWKFVTKTYHKRKRTTSTANIKVKSSLLGYKTMLLANVTPRACAD